VPPPTNAPPAAPVPPPPPPPRDFKGEGRVRNVSGSCPNVRFTLDGQTIVVNDDTRIRGGSCRSLRNGAEVDVKGVYQSDGSVRAREIKIEEDDD
jgi:hypothetical protein